MTSVGLQVKVRAGICCAVAVWLAGCGGSAQVPDKPSEAPAANLGKLFAAYRQASVELKRGPKSFDEIKKHLGADAEKVRVSPRDQQPYEIVWGVDVTKLTPSPTNPLVFAYERTGKDGQRYVLTDTGPRLMTASELRNAQFPPGHKPKLD